MGRKKLLTALKRPYYSFLSVCKNLCGEIKKEYFPVQEKHELLANLKNNWFFLFSAMAFFCLSAKFDLGYFIGIPIALIIIAVISSQISSAWSIFKQQAVGIKIFCIVSAVGICLFNQMCFYRRLIKIKSIVGLPEFFDKPFLLVSYFVAAVALFFVVCLLLLFWKKMKQIISENNMVDNVHRKEWIIYGLLVIASVVFVVYSFAQSQAFYGADFTHDIIYTSDSRAFIKENVYLSLTHGENDLRQPLFAVFAAPFSGVLYLIGRLFDASVSVQAMLANSIQIVMLFFANYMLTKIMKLDLWKRICFMIVTSCTYTQFLFILVIEQYIVAYFWLIFCVYLIVEKHKLCHIALFGASGTLLTSMALLPFVSEKSPIREFKLWFLDIVKYVMGFVVLLLAFCRFDVIFSAISKITFLSRFTGKSVPFVERMYQYTGFISSCFVGPDADAYLTSAGRVTWQLNPMTGMNYIGAAILLLAVFSFIWNRNKKSTLMATVWVVFSVIMLLLFGWGTKENGLILYALYFGWAFLVLLFQLLEKIEEKLHVRFLLPFVTACAVAALLAINIPAIKELLDFAIIYYPA